jgi:uncharacterized protein DUF5681
MAFGPNIGVATRWKKGQLSPNPGGRPKSRVLSEALRTRLAEVRPGDPAGRTYAEVVVENLIEIACSEVPGAVHAASEIADRLAKTLISRWRSCKRLGDLCAIRWGVVAHCRL